MANIIFGGGSSFNSSSFVGVPGSPPLQASVGSVTTITVGVNTAIQSFYPFATVQYGISPYTYGVSSGTLPTGITLDTSTGQVSGTPTATQAVSNVVFSVTDSLGVVSSTTATVAFTVNAAITATANSVAPVAISANQSVGSFYPFASVAGGTLPYYYFISSGTLPDRVTLDSTTGLVTGTPTEPYLTATVTFSVRDGGGIVASTTSAVSFTVNPAFSSVPSATSSVLGYQNSAITSFNPFSSVTGGYTPYVYSVSSGTLPTNVTLNTSTGLVSGTPTALQSASNVTFTVTDNKGTVALLTSTVSFTVNAALVVTAGATTTVLGYQSSAITSFNPFSSVSGGYTPYVYGIVSGTLPTGVTLNTSTGQVSGTPSATYATANVTFKVTDNQGTISPTTSTVSFTVNAALTATAGATTTVSVQQNTAITSFNPFSSVTGGYTPYFYFVSSGTLPTNITINSSTGLVSGTPTATYATANVTFSVRDVNNVTAITTQTVSFTVYAPAAPYTVNYLVVAGGGGGASGDKLSYGQGGGGGAGGLLASTFTANPGTSYTINVGGGALGSSPTTSPTGPFYGSSGASGSSSNIFQGATPIVTTTGGGGGGFSGTCGGGSPIVAGPGLTGGSGGGGGGASKPPGAYTVGTGGIATGSPGVGVTGPQGFPGGAGSGSPQPSPTQASGGGGGGGKGGAGTAAVTPTSTTGAGGAGAIWTYTGPTVFYAGGGGGGGTASAPQSSGGAGGSGVGGAGSPGPTGGAGSPGTNATGSGGGGAAGTNTGGNGGSGVVKFAIPNAAYPTVSAPGATTSNPPAAPGLTVITYTPTTPTSPQTFTFTA